MQDPDYIPSGFMHPDKRRVGALGRSGDGKRSAVEAAETMGRVFVERANVDRAKELADSVAAVRAAKPSNARSRREAPKGRRAKTIVARDVGPTAARLAKGDVVIVGGIHRSEPPIERLRNDLDSDAKTRLGMFLGAEKLRRHFAGHIDGVRATDSLDLDGVMSSGGHTELSGDEGWVYHYDEYKKACRMMGYYSERPHHGCARIVVSVVCNEMTVSAASQAHLPSQRTDRAQAIAMDRLRSGLLTLAHHWSFL